jgi:Transglycosylase SLT domain
MTMSRRSQLRSTLAIAAAFAALCPLARAAEHITLRNGFELDCVRRETTGDRVRLYLLPSNGQPATGDTNYIEVAVTAVLRADPIPDPPPPPPTPAATTPLAPQSTTLTPAEMHEMLARAGTSHNIDADLLASLVHAESNGNPRAVSRTGAQGLMQLMPGTASRLGVQNSFAPEQNIGGGTAYLDALLTRYHDNMALALAAYNAGPAAVDRYHGIPPYAETRAYVARVIREFNRLKRVGAAALSTQLAAK